jgi:hypothetical protein
MIDPYGCSGLLPHFLKPKLQGLPLGIILRQRQPQWIGPATTGCGLLIQFIGASLDRRGNGIVRGVIHTSTLLIYLSVS